jgi:hypothetical protein
MSDLLTVAANDLVKREHPRLVAATGLFFKKLGDNVQRRSLNEVLESARGGVWGQETAPGSGYPVLRSTNMRGVYADVVDPAWRDIPDKQAGRCQLDTGDIIVTKRPRQ